MTDCQVDFENPSKGSGQTSPIYYMANQWKSVSKKDNIWVLLIPNKIIFKEILMRWSFQ